MRYCSSSSCTRKRTRLEESEFTDKIVLLSADREQSMTNANSMQSSSRRTLQTRYYFNNFLILFSQLRSLEIDMLLLRCMVLRHGMLCDGDRC